MSTSVPFGNIRYDFKENDREDKKWIEAAHRNLSNCMLSDWNLLKFQTELQSYIALSDTESKILLAITLMTKKAVDKRSN
jgi:hypothetical protein